MPNYGVVGGQTVSWQYATKPRVFIGASETEIDWMTCTAIEHTAGISPSRAILRIGGQALYATGPVTLNRYTYPWTRGTKVIIKVGDVVRFRGCMMKRRDSGGSNQVIWEAWDDRWLLQQIPIRGALVRDPVTGEIKFVSAYEARCNPGGRWNCVGAMFNGAVYPVFSHIADAYKTYEAPDEAFSPNLASGQLTAWTPRRYLQYLRLLTRLGGGDVQGVDYTKWRSLKECDRLEWLDSANNLIGKDTEQEFDPLDRKLPDMSFRGMKMLGAIHRILEAAGTHGLYLEYTDTKSYVSFYPRGFSGALDVNFSAVDFRLLRGGPANDINTIYDFELEEDASETAESVLVEGARVHVESEFDTSSGVATLTPAWTAAQETAFKAMITGDGQHALFPSVINTTDLDSVADGSVDGIFARAKTPEAVALARQFWPTVGRAFVINSVNLAALGITEGLSGEFADQDFYPLLNIKGRKVNSEQLQFYVGDEGDRLAQKYPARIQINQNGEWKDVPFGVGFRVDERNWIWIDGLWEEADGGSFCLYDGKLLGAASDPDATVTRDMRLNAAIALDHRVDGYAESDLDSTSFDVDLFLQLGGPPLTYIDSPNAYHEEIQFNSSPTPARQVLDADGVNYVDTPITRYLPPGTERSHAQYAAERKLFSDRWVRRRSQWDYVGIRPDFKIGQWVGVVKVINSDIATDSDYEINAPIEQITDNFMAQSTIIGGLLSTASRKAQMAKGGEDTDGKQAGDMNETQKADYEKIISGETESVGGFVGAKNIANNRNWMNN